MTRSQIRQFRRSLRRFERLVTYQFKNCSCGVTFAQCLILLEIEEHGQATMGQLATQLRLDGSTLSRTVDGLVRSGLAERVNDDHDRRVVRMRLTPEGSSVCEAIHKENDACCRQLMQKIPESRRGAVIRNFETLVQAFLDWEADQPGQGCKTKAPAEAGRRTRAASGGR